jgi:membrane protein
VWTLLKNTIASFIEDEALSRGAAIAFYTVTSLAPILLIVIAIAGFAFGAEAARGAIIDELTSLMGPETADILAEVIANASDKSSGIWATVIGFVTLLVTASGVFGEMQTALSKVWDTSPRGTAVSRLIWARAVSLGLVATLGFLLLVSLVVSAALTALGSYLNAVLPFGELLFSVLNFLISLLLIAALFAAIFKVLPGRPIAWRDAIFGAMVTAVLFTIGKSLIGWYLGSSAVASSYGAAGGLIILLLWVYYSAQVFLLGAEFTRAYALSRGRVDDTAKYSAQTPEPERNERRVRQFNAKHTKRVADMSINEEGASLRSLERQAEANRAALIGTVQALQSKLAPSAIKHDVQDYVREKKDSFLQNIRQKALENPVQTAALAAGAAYPLLGIVSRIPVPLLLIGAGFALASKDGGGRQFAGVNGERFYRDDGREAYGEEGGLIQETGQRAAEAVSSLQETVTTYVDKAGQQVRGGIATAREAGEELAASVRRTSHDVSATARDFSAQARERVSYDALAGAGASAGDWAQETVNRNPLLVGALGVALGAVLAAAFPVTRSEKQYLGDAADSVKRRVTESASEGVRALKTASSEVAGEMAAALRAEGVSGEGFRAAVGHVADDLKTAASEALNSGTKSPDSPNEPPFSTSTSI